MKWHLFTKMRLAIWWSCVLEGNPLAAKGYSHVSGIDFGDIFSPIAKVSFIRLFLSIIASFYFQVEQMDMKTTFLDGDMEEEMT